MFSSTAVTNGSADGIVVAVGMKTEIGIIQAAVQDADTESKTPLQEKLDEFGGQLANVIFVSGGFKIGKRRKTI